MFNAPSGTAFDKDGAVLPPAAIETPLVETPAVVMPPVETPAVPPVVDIPQPTPVEIDWAAALAEKTGGKFKTWEELNSKLETPAEIAYANEESKKIAQYLKEGKVDDVLQVYNEQRRLSTVKDMADSDVIKLAMEYKQPNFDLTDIREDFESRFTLDKPEAPDKEDYLEDEAFELAQKKYNKELTQYTKQEKALVRTMKAEAAEARKYLSSLQKDIVLPDIALAPNVPDVDPVAEEAERANWEASRNEYLASLQQSSAEFKEIPFEITDEGFSFKGSYKIDDAENVVLSKNLAEKDVVNDLLMSRYGKDGKYNTTQLMKDLYLLDNSQKIIASAVKQAVAQDRLDTLRHQKNIELTGQRNDHVPSTEAAVQEFSNAWYAAR